MSWKVPEAGSSLWCFCRVLREDAASSPCWAKLPLVGCLLVVSSHYNWSPEGDWVCVRACVYADASNLSSFDGNMCPFPGPPILWSIQLRSYFNIALVTGEVAQQADVPATQT